MRKEKQKWRCVKRVCALTGWRCETSQSQAPQQPKQLNTHHAKTQMHLTRHNNPNKLFVRSLYAVNENRQLSKNAYTRMLLLCIINQTLGISVRYYSNQCSHPEKLLQILLLGVSVVWLDSGSGWLSVMSLLSVVLSRGQVARWNACVLLREADSRISLRVEHRTVRCSSSVGVHQAMHLISKLQKRCCTD